MRNSFSDPAERRPADAEIGGDLVKGNRIENIRMLLDQIEIALFRRQEQETLGPLHGQVEGHFGDQPAQALPLVGLAVQLVQVVDMDIDHAGVRYSFREIVAGRLVNETLKGYNHLVG